MKRTGRGGQEGDGGSQPVIETVLCLRAGWVAFGGPDRAQARSRVFVEEAVTWRCVKRGTDGQSERRIEADARPGAAEGETDGVRRERRGREKCAGGEVRRTTLVRARVDDQGRNRHSPPPPADVSPHPPTHTPDESLASKIGIPTHPPATVQAHRSVLLVDRTLVASQGLDRIIFAVAI